MTELRRPAEWPRVARFIAGLVIALAIFIGGVRWVPGFSSVCDPFVILAVFHAVTGGTLGGLVGGLVAGWLTDALTGGPYGLFGLADGVVGYFAAFTAQRIVVTRAPGIFLLFSVAAAVQQAILVGVLLLVMPAAQLPAYGWLLMKVVATGFGGVILFAVRRRFGRRVDYWRRSRHARIRFGS